MKRFAAVSLLGIVLGCSSDRARSNPQQQLAPDASASDSGLTPDSSQPSFDAGIPGLDAGDLPGLSSPCNGHDAFCSIAYDEFCQVATHDSAANSSTYWLFPAQRQSVRNQLDNGIRALMLNVQSANGSIVICRGNCVEGSTVLAGVLQQVKDFLDVNAREVVTVLIDTQLAAAQIEAEFVAKGLDSMAHAQAPNSPWPTLGEMIESGQRLVVMANTPDVGSSWLLPRGDWLWETGSNWPSLIAMNCNPVVGNGALALVHHNLMAESDGGLPQPSESLAAEANDFVTATTRLQACRAQFKQAPNFIAVDFFDLGDPVGATQVMNGVRAAP